MKNSKRNKYDVFISHSTSDKERVKSHLIRVLKHNSVSYWIDEERIKPADNIFKKIEDGLENSRWVIVVLSTSGGNTPWCRSEYETALRDEIEGKETKVIPALLDKLKRSDIPRFLRGKDNVNLWDHDAVKKLIKRIQITPAKYCDWILSQPLISGRLYNGNYTVEPSDLLNIVLKEVDLKYGTPVRAVRQKEDTYPLQELITDLLDPDSVRLTKGVVLFGEAGVGKTTTCKWFLRKVAESFPGKSKILPVYIPLGYWSGNDFDDFLNTKVPLLQNIPGFLSYNDVIGLAQYEEYRILFLIDGWNEQKTENLKEVQAFAYNQIQSGNIVLITSRPVAAVENILHDEDVRFYEIQRWTPGQLENFFRKNNRIDLHKQIPKKVINSLNLPLLSFHLINVIDENNPLPTLNTIADVYEYVINRLLDQGSQKGRNLIAKSVDKNSIKYLQKLAYFMTKKKIVQTEGLGLEKVLGEKSPGFKALLAFYVNSGLLRCSNTIAALDCNASVSELRNLKISFLHQAFQEYMTAQHLTFEKKPAIPKDVSHDAFWREIPIYIMRIYNDAKEKQLEFALSFLKGKSSDLLTCARLANEITDPAESAGLKRDIISRLLKNIEQNRLYPYAIETFDTLGAQGIMALQGSIYDPSCLKKMCANSETHIIKGIKPDDGQWRRYGRSIYILAELGDFWIAEHFNEHIESISSLHLLYHLGEAFLTLSRLPNSSEKNLKFISSAAYKLLDQAYDDPVVQGYACAIIHSCGGENLRSQYASRLKDFLLEQIDNNGLHFEIEFWRRAHGVEAFSEIASPNDCYIVLDRLFVKENIAEYKTISNGSYLEVHSSILKAMLRLCNLSNGADTGNWLPLIEKMLISKRIDENGWALRHLERLLRKWFSSADYLRWLKKWQQSEQLQNSRVAKVLSNVIWHS